MMSEGTDAEIVREALTSSRVRRGDDLAAFDRILAQAWRYEEAVKNIEAASFGGIPSQERFDIIHEVAAAVLSSESASGRSNVPVSAERYERLKIALGVLFNAQVELRMDTPEDEELREQVLATVRRLVPDIKRHPALGDLRPLPEWKGEHRMTWAEQITAELQRIADANGLKLEDLPTRPLGQLNQYALARRSDGSLYWRKEI